MISSPTQLYSQEELKKIKHIPKHVAIIPDGNRRWAKQRLASTQVGHSEGCSVVIDIVDAAKQLGIAALTVYTFSTENWSRSKEEVDLLMQLLESFLIEERERMVRNQVRLCTIGELGPLPENVKKEIQISKEATKHCTGIDFILALNYGSKDEILRAIRSIAAKVKSQEIQPDLIDSQIFETHLDTAPWPLPDLLIRTGGESRVSNFLLWQLAYAELFLTSTLWPDFNSRHFLDAILWYQERERRWGV